MAEIGLHQLGFLRIKISKVYTDAVLCSQQNCQHLFGENSREVEALGFMSGKIMADRFCPRRSKRFGVEEFFVLIPAGSSNSVTIVDVLAGWMGERLNKGDGVAFEVLVEFNGELRPFSLGPTRKRLVRLLLSSSS